MGWRGEGEGGGGRGEEIKLGMTGGGGQGSCPKTMQYIQLLLSLKTNFTSDENRPGISSE